MTPREWKNFAIDLIDGLERQLCSSAPKTARLQLAELRECASKATTIKARKSCEQRLDKLIESTPFFRAAARRHVGERADITIDGIERSLEGMINLARVRGDKKAERRIAKILADFRKNRRKPIYKPVKKIGYICLRKKRRRAAALQDAARDTMIPEIREASWTAPALWRFARRWNVREVSVRT
jgi:hypothetical protein